VPAVVAPGAGAVAGASTAAGPSTAPAIAPAPAANGSQIAIKVGFRLGTLRLPVPFMTWLIDSMQKRKTKVNENLHPDIDFRILTFDVIIIFEQVNRLDATVNE
jgi:hypothetical protein